MKLASFKAIITKLNEADVRYLIVGGLAVNAHGNLRYTKDVDFVIQLVPDNIINTFKALGALGYKPLVPITGEQFANQKLRESWIKEKGMQVLQFWCDKHAETPIDVFVTEPFDFDKEYNHSMNKTLEDGKMVHFVTIPTLIKMKKTAGRPQDILDIEFLKTRLKND